MHSIKNSCYSLSGNNEEQKITVSEVEPLNIEARYPEYKSNMAKMLSRQKCLEIYEQTKKLQQWIKEKILSIG
ncbi:MAG: hypothetical protein LBU42_03090 [Prevotellaceae bacterium]|nr:hypothetical protein [Prevotellaceae bacterium]